MTAQKQLESSVRAVGAAWASSSYYDDAERWSSIFWREKSTFYELFKQLDLASVLDLACGHGRHSEKIVDRTGTLWMMDIHESNIEACRRRLATKHERVQFFVNNGYNFQPLADESLTAIFCYDAMVHFSPDIVESYLADAVRVLRPGGKALLHHSNYAGPLAASYGQNPHSRNHMTQHMFGFFAAKAGLKLLDSLVVRWAELENLDCISLVQKQ